MIAEVIAGFLVMLVIAQLLRFRHRQDHSVLYSAAAIAVSLTLNIDAVYVAVDGVLGGRNVADLIANALLMIGLYFLFRAVIGAAWKTGAEALRTPLRWFLVASVAVLIVTFFFIDAPRSSTTFMIDYGAQPTAAVYSILQFVFIGLVTGTGAYVCAAYAWRMNRWSYRIGFSLIGVGCVFAVALSVLVIAMDVAHVSGHDATLRSLQSWYWLLYAPALISMSIGAAIPAVAGWAASIRQRRRLTRLLAPLEQIWQQVNAARYQLPASPTAAESSIVERVHRMNIEVRDALLRRPDVETTLSADQLALLETVDRNLKRR